MFPMCRAASDRGPLHVRLFFLNYWLHVLGNLRLQRV